MPKHTNVATTTTTMNYGYDGMRESNAHVTPTLVTPNRRHRHHQNPNQGQSQHQGKELIVRLLAEVFHVSSQAGQVRWQQVSQSLVPISVYSRTPRVWLNHWLQILHPTSSYAHQMQLQHYHQAQLASLENTMMIFQIVAHQPRTNNTNVDQIDQALTISQQQQHLVSASNLPMNSRATFSGQMGSIISNSHNSSNNYFRLIDVKLIQPGTRLGQASEYFIYWKDTSFNETWGLNFSSTQDARQFYDICTLNLVNLNPDLNSQFFKNILLYQQQQLPPFLNDYRVNNNSSRINNNNFEYNNNNNILDINQPYNNNLGYTTLQHDSNSNNHNDKDKKRLFAQEMERATLNNIYRRKQQPIQQQQHQQLQLQLQQQPCRARTFSAGQQLRHSQSYHALFHNLQHQHQQHHHQHQQHQQHQQSQQQQPMFGVNNTRSNNINNNVKTTVNVPSSKRQHQRKQQQQQQQQQQTDNNSMRLRSRSASRHAAGNHQQQTKFNLDNTTQELDDGPLSTTANSQDKLAGAARGAGSQSTPVSPARRCLATYNRQYQLSDNDLASEKNSVRHHPQCSMLLLQQQQQQQQQQTNCSNRGQQRSSNRHLIGDQIGNGDKSNLKSATIGNENTSIEQRQKQPAAANANLVCSNQVSCRDNADMDQPEAVHHHQQQRSSSNVDFQDNTINKTIGSNGKAPPVPAHQSSVASSQSLHSKREGRVRYMGNISQQQQQQQQAASASSNQLNLAPVTNSINNSTSVYAKSIKQPSNNRSANSVGGLSSDNQSITSHNLYNRQSGSANCPIHCQQQSLKICSRNMQRASYMAPQRMLMPIDNSQMVPFYCNCPYDDYQTTSADTIAKPIKQQFQLTSPQQQLFSSCNTDQTMDSDQQHHQLHHLCCKYWSNYDADQPPPVKPRSISEQRGVKVSSNINQPSQQQHHRKNKSFQNRPMVPMDSSVSFSSMSSQTNARNARQARAQYARSRNQNEFRSLDVGGVQPSQAQIDLINENLRHHQRQFAKQQHHQQQQQQQQKRQQSKKSDNLVGSESKDKQQQIIAKSRSTDDMRNVATTTDDLPIDPETLKTMLMLSCQHQPTSQTDQTDHNSQQQQYQLMKKSTSESERLLSLAEPTCEQQQSKSPKKKRAATLALMSDPSRENCFAHATNNYLDGNSIFSLSPNASGRTSQNRALSLALDFNDINRSRATRSDIGRRRSLERTSCIDFDSPVPQFNLAAGNLASSALSKSCSQRLNNNQSDMPDNAHYTPSMTKNRKLNQASSDYLAMSYNTTKKDDTINKFTKRNSRYDATTSDYEQRLKWALENDSLDLHEHQRRTASLRKVMQSMVDSENDGHDYDARVSTRKHFHSCPNSLRKKRQTVDDDHRHRYTYLSDMESNQSLYRSHQDDIYDYYAGDDHQQEDDGLERDLLYKSTRAYCYEECDEALGIGILNTSSFDTCNSNNGNIEHVNDLHHYQFSNNNNMLSSSSPFHAMLVTNDDINQQHISSTRASSRCSSTNCKYGLYDSDDDDDDDDDEEEEEGVDDGGDGAQVHNAVENHNVAFSSIELNYIGQDDVGAKNSCCVDNNSNSNTHKIVAGRERSRFRAVDCAYDKTMLRHCDKIKKDIFNDGGASGSSGVAGNGSAIRERRARSEPSPIEILLSRSMDNVQKKMLEAQAELDIIRRGEDYNRLKEHSQSFLQSCMTKTNTGSSVDTNKLETTKEPQNCTSNNTKRRLQVRLTTATNSDLDSPVSQQSNKIKGQQQQQQQQRFASNSKDDDNDGLDDGDEFLHRKTVFRKLKQPLSLSDNEIENNKKTLAKNGRQSQGETLQKSTNGSAKHSKMTIEERLALGTHSSSAHHQEDYHQHINDSCKQQQCISFGSKSDQHDIDLQRSSTKKAAKFRCSGAVRKAGFLSVKKWILKRRQSIELARKRGWKRYWVCLRGTTLLFHSLVDSASALSHQLEQSNTNEDDDHNQLMGHTFDLARFNNIGSCIIETEPRHLIILDGSIAQPVPEHPKRDHVFCLSTTFGDAYLFQSSCQVETDNWIEAIHNACAASLARDQGRTLTMRLITGQLRKITLEAELKTRLRHKLEMKLSSMLRCLPRDQTTTRPRPKSDQQQLLEDRAQLCHHLQLINVNLEQLQCELYQLRCYLASCKSLPYINTMDISQNCQSTDTSVDNTLLCGVELPHPKTLLMHVSKPTKLILNKLGVFTVSSFHAYVCARAGGPYAIMNHLRSLLSSSTTDIGLRTKNKQSNDCSIYLRERSLSSSASLKNNLRLKNKNDQDSKEKVTIKSNSLNVRISEQLLNKANVSDDSKEEKSMSDVLVTVNNASDLNSQQILYLAFNQIKLKERLQVNPSDYFILLTRSSSNQDDYVPTRKELFDIWPTHDQVRIEKKISYQIRLTRESLKQRFGFSVEAKLYEQDSYDELCVYCSRVEQDGLAFLQGLQTDDEIIVINGAQVSDLDMMFIENTLHEELSLKMKIKSSRLRIPHSAKTENDSDNNDGEDDDENFKTYQRSSPTINKTTGLHDKTETNTDDYLKCRDGNNLSQVRQRLKSINSAELSSNYVPITDEYIASLVCPPPPPQSALTVSLQSDSLKNGNKVHSSKMVLSSESNNHLIMESSNNAHMPSRMEYDSNDEFTTKQNLTKNVRLDIIDKYNQNSIDQSNGSKSVLSVESTKESQVKVPINIPKDTQPQKELKNPSDNVKAKVNLDCSTDQNCHTDECFNPKGIMMQSNEPDACKKPIVPAKPTHVKEAIRSLIEGRASSKESCHSDKKGSTNVERLRKSILEILETERAYVDHLNSVIDLYMEPLKNSDYLQVDDIKQLSNTITDIAAFQSTFHENLRQEIIDRAWNRNDSGQDIDKLSLTSLSNHLLLFNTVEEFSDILLGIADTFLSYADKFKLYSTFCASYSKLQKLLHPTSVHQSNSSASLLNDTFSSNGNSTFFSHLSNNSSGGTNSQTFIYSYKLNEFFVNLTSSSNKHPIEEKQNGISNINNIGGHLNTSTLKKHLHQQHFESYLIKPIQRVVKYPLLISSLVHLAKDDSFEHKQLIAAMKQMEQVAGHINDMQRIHEEYGFIFDHLQRQYCQQQTTCDTFQSQSTTNTGIAIGVSSGSHQPLVDLNVGELLYYGNVNWLNMHEFSGKVKKSQELHPIVFVFSSAVVFLCKERIRQKKKLSIPLTANKMTDIVEVIRYQALIPVSEVQVRSLPASNCSSQQNLVKEYKTSSIVESASSLSLTTGSNVKNIPATEASKQSNDTRLASPPASFQWELFKCCPANVNAGLIANAGVRRADGKVYLFSNSSNELRNAFLRKIRYIIRESVRNMNVPLARSPSSKSLSSKKMTSSSSSSSVSSPLAPMESNKKRVL